MTLVADVVTRLGTEVDALTKRIEGAAELTELVRKNELPNVTPWAFVIPLGLMPRSQGDAATGVFTQGVDELIGVVLIVRSSGDAKGGKALTPIDALIEAVLPALLGWAPDAAIGVLRLVRGAMVGLVAGAATYQLDFALQRQVRVLA
ncbi:MAG: hypothetical protein WDM94_09245 [Bauldia sp.]